MWDEQKVDERENEDDEKGESSVIGRKEMSVKMRRHKGEEDENLWEKDEKLKKGWKISWRKGRRKVK